MTTNSSHREAASTLRPIKDFGPIPDSLSALDKLKLRKIDEKLSELNLDAPDARYRYRRETDPTTHEHTLYLGQSAMWRCHGSFTLTSMITAIEYERLRQAQLDEIGGRR